MVWKQLVSREVSDVRGFTAGTELAGKRIILCVCGSVAAIRSPDLARELQRRGATVVAAMSPEACRLLHPNLMQWATKKNVITELSGMLEHVALVGDHSEKADLVLVAPATANTIGKMACGIDDTAVTTILTTAIGSGVPILIAPAMHLSMYRHPIVLENIEKLKNIGVQFIGPELREDKARLAEVPEIVDYVIRALAKKDLQKKSVVVSAGATREYLDDVRFISNPSTGKMGIAVAREAWLRGADVTLYVGHVEAEIPPYLKILRAESVEAMEGIQSEAADYAVLAAAVADFTVAKTKGKLPSDKGVSLELTPAAKICSRMKAKNLVLFKAESGVSDNELEAVARKRMEEYGAVAIVANDVSRKGTGFAVDTNEVLILMKKGTKKASGTKADVARAVWDAVLGL
jgi:phosphopantothenoylcysteine decarboxylase/phosphopantothenate--cysteine ligase